jgi:dihydrodipicolinate synthase/N-acetylneuraminate lyase
MIELKGVIPALTTPFRDDQSLSLEGFRDLVDFVTEDGVHGIVVNGCTGEYWAVGYVDSSTPVLGRKSLDYYRAATEGDLETARRLQTEMDKLNAGFFGVGTFPAGVKFALDLLGRPGGITRDPIKPLNTEQQERVKEVLISAGIISTQEGLRETA